MAVQELATAVAERLPCHEVISNNGTLGPVDQCQTTGYGGRRSAVEQPEVNIDFKAIARGFDARGVTVRSLDALDAALRLVDIFWAGRR